MKTPCYIGLTEARALLATIGIELTPRQMKRAADLKGDGTRKLPFFPDPITGRLRIEKNTLLEIFNRCEVNAENNAQKSPLNLKKSFENRV